MARSASNPFDDAGGARRRLSIAAAVAAAVTLLLLFLEIGSGINLKLLDTWFRMRPVQDPSPQVVIVGIDQKSLAVRGPWPWPRDLYVPLIERLKGFGARVIGLDITFGPNPREDEPVAGPDGQPGPSRNQQLAAAFRAAGNVVYGFEFADIGDPSPPGAPPPDPVARNAMPGFDTSGLAILPAPGLAPSEMALADAAAALGHVNTMPESDSTLRWYQLLIKHGDRHYPALGLQVARVYMQKKMEDYKVKEKHIELDYADVPMTESGRMLLNWTSTNPAFPTYSFVEVERGEVPAEAFKDKAVLIAATAPGMDDRNLPFVKATPGVITHATFLDNVFRVHFLRWPLGSWLAELAATLLALATGVLVYPRLKTIRLLLLGPALLAGVIGLSFLLFFASDIWFRPWSPALAVALPFLTVVGLKLRESEEATRDVAAEKHESDKLLGLSFQEKGMLDMALATFNKLALTGEMKLIYLNLGMDFENRGLKEKAFLAYKRVFDADPGYEDIAGRMEALRQQGVGTRMFAAGTMELQGGVPTGFVPAATHSGTGLPTQAAMEGESPTLAPGEMPPAPASARTAGPTLQPTRAALSGTSATAAPRGRTAAGMSPEMPTLALPAKPTLELRKQFGRYEMLEKLGRGAMGEVFKVRDPKIGRIAAMKTIRVEGELSPQQLIELRQRFYREAQTAGKLTHPNIVTIYDVGEEEGISYIVMEFVEGQTLTSLMKKHKNFSISQIKHVVVNAALGLDYAHQNGVIHRDVKPDNIMVSRTGVVKVMDFGIARIVESDMTRTGSILGTPAYMSPEQFSGKKVDGRADVFSLGVVLYELLAHKRPFRGDTPTAVMFEILQKDPPPPSAEVPGLNPAWDSIVKRAVAKSPDERYTSAKDLAGAVSAIPGK